MRPRTEEELPVKAGNKVRGRPELLLPAGSPEILRSCVRFGADAVYIGGEAFGLRAAAKNFNEDEMADAISFARKNGVKVYVTANIIAHNSDLKEAESYFLRLKELGPDALIIADPGMFSLAGMISFKMLPKDRNKRYFAKNGKGGIPCRLAGALEMALLLLQES